MDPTYWCEIHVRGNRDASHVRDKQSEILTPANTAAPLTMILWATWSCTAIYPPADRPDTVMVLMLYLANWGSVLSIVISLALSLGWISLRIKDSNPTTKQQLNRDKCMCMDASSWMLHNLWREIINHQRQSLWQRRSTLNFICVNLVVE